MQEHNTATYQHAPLPSRDVRSYYPHITLDPFWNVVYTHPQNSALAAKISDLTRLAGRDVHFFELLFNDQFHRWWDNASPNEWDNAANISLGYFKTIVSGSHDTPDPHNMEFDQIMDHLRKLSGFSEKYGEAEQFPVNEMPRYSGASVSVHNLHLPYSFSGAVQLSFHCNVWFPPFERRHEENYLVTLVPEDDIAEVAVILEQLVYSPLVLGKLGNTALDHILWGIVVIKTVEEGFKRGGIDQRWNPQLAFRRIYREVRVADEESAATLLKESIANLSASGVLTTEQLYEMMISFAEERIPDSELSSLLIVSRYKELPDRNSNQSYTRRQAERVDFLHERYARLDSLYFALWDSMHVILPGYEKDRLEEKVAPGFPEFLKGPRSLDLGAPRDLDKLKAAQERYEFGITRLKTEVAFQLLSVSCRGEIIPDSMLEKDPNEIIDILARHNDVEIKLGAEDTTKVVNMLASYGDLSIDIERQWYERANEMAEELKGKSDWYMNRAVHHR